MPLNVNKLTLERATFDWEYMGETLKVTYHPKRWTARLEDEVRQQLDEGRPGAGMVDAVMTLISNVEGLEVEEGVPMPWDKEHVFSLPTAFILDLIGEVQGQNRPSSEEGKVSDDTSRPTGSLVSVPTGTDS